MPQVRRERKSDEEIVEVSCSFSISFCCPAHSLSCFRLHCKPSLSTSDAWAMRDRTIACVRGTQKVCPDSAHMGWSWTV